MPGGPLHAPAVYARTVSPVPTELEAEWAPEPVWTTWKREKSFASTGDLNPGRSNPSLIFVQQNITDREDQQPPLSSMNLL